LNIPIEELEKSKESGFLPIPEGAEEYWWVKQEEKCALCKGKTSLVGLNKRVGPKGGHNLAKQCETCSFVKFGPEWK
jgi:hypothetical protein